MTDLEFLESMSDSDRLIDHLDDCGHCGMQIIMAQVARDLIAKGGGTIAEWDKETKKRWQDTKYFKLYQVEKEAGRDPHIAFDAKGWEM